MKTAHTRRESTPSIINQRDSIRQLQSSSHNKTREKNKELMRKLTSHKQKLEEKEQQMIAERKKLEQKEAKPKKKLSDIEVMHQLLRKQHSPRPIEIKQEDYAVHTVAQIKKQMAEHLSRPRIYFQNPKDKSTVMKEFANTEASILTGRELI